ncbi:hypothetical protein VNI00_004916 [Paramarasmius palmivorus]|uniref:HNH nuclease domain-containing protein n=1 Tax=Paramarasmius palmivorus TaxID=297713 RepID=A0AAW0DI39_9AGAR
MAEYRLGNRGQDPYLNRTERNIHIWSSMLSPQNRLCIVGGLFTGVDHGTFKFTTLDVYQIIRMIVNENYTSEWLTTLPPQTGGLTGIHRQGYELQPLDFDPSQYVDDPNAYTRRLQQTSPRFVPESNTIDMGIGHYALFVYVTSEGRFTNRYSIKLTIICKLIDRYGQEVILARAPYLHRPPIASRTRTGRSTPGTSTPGRASGPRDQTRDRDRRCRVTGQQARNRTRGPNYAGLQVAHIIPLAHCDKILQMLDPDDQHVASWVSMASNAEFCHNALLLRSDIHDQFDGYQFSYKWCAR